MKKLVSNILLVFAIITHFGVSKARALEISSRLSENNSGEFEKQTIVSCNPNESLSCQKLCNHDSQCLVPETLCPDCVGLKNQNIRTAFTDLPFLYRRDVGVVSEEESIDFLRAGQFILISSDSYLNIFNANHKEQIKRQFNAFCPNSPDISDSLLIASLNEDSQIHQFVGIICTNTLHQSLIYPLKYNPEYSVQKINYWKSNP